MFTFKPKIIFVNGPPRAGKDTVSGILDRYINQLPDLFAYQTKFTQPMDRIMSSAWDSCYLSNKFSFKQIREQFKDEKVMHGGKTPRECLIDLSENWFKSYFGPTIFGRLAATEVDKYNRATGGDNVVIFSDSGFYQEAYGLVGSVETVTPGEMVVIQVHRDGCSFENDSRSWLTLEDIDIPLIQLSNNGTLAELENVCYNLFHDLFIQPPDQTPVTSISNETITSSGSGSLGTADPAEYVTYSGEIVASASGCDDDCGKGDDNVNIQTRNE